MAGGAGAGVDEAGVAAMEVGEGAAQPVLIGRHQDHMDVVGHQAPRPDLRPRSPGRLREKIAIERVVAFLKEGRAPPVAALGHMMRQAGDDEAG